MILFFHDFVQYKTVRLKQLSSILFKYSYLFSPNHSYNLYKLMIRLNKKYNVMLHQNELLFLQKCRHDKKVSYPYSTLGNEVTLCIVFVNASID